MNSPVLHAVRAGLRRGLIEYRHSLTSRDDVTYIVIINAILLAVIVLQRGSTVAGTPYSLAALTLPSLAGMMVAVGGLMGAATLLASHREDGTLLRAKATPHGMVGYLVSVIMNNTLSIVGSIVTLLVAGVILLDDLRSVSLTGWLTLLWVLVLGMLATLPWGALIGSLVSNPASGFGLNFLLIGGLVAISGIFYPITALPGWVQGLAQVFPVYWLGLGMRSALLPDAAAAAELGDSWRHLETAAVLGAWAVVGLLLAPAVLRRMARLESGSTMEARKQRALQRGY
jgi:ABC-2 type transport system permease protein